MQKTTSYSSPSSPSVIQVLFSVVMSVFLLGALTAPYLITPERAYADAFSSQAQSGESEVINDVHTGNLFVINAPVTNKEIGTDFYGHGEALQASGITVGAQGNGSACVAGNELSFTDSTINGSLRPAGQTIIELLKLLSPTISLLQCMTITTGSDVTAKGLYAAGRTIKAGGTYLGSISKRIQR